MIAPGGQDGFVEGTCHYHSLFLDVGLQWYYTNLLPAKREDWTV